MTSRAAHFREAERLLSEVADIDGQIAGKLRMRTLDASSAATAIGGLSTLIARAQVHATLATVEAIVLDEDDRTARTVDLTPPTR